MKGERQGTGDGAGREMGKAAGRETGKAAAGAGVTEAAEPASGHEGREHRADARHHGTGPTAGPHPARSAPPPGGNAPTLGGIAPPPGLGVPPPGNATQPARDIPPPGGSASQAARYAPPRDLGGPPRGLTYPFPEPPPPGTGIRVAEGILWFRMPLPMRLDHVNIYALEDGDGWTVVDTGFDDAPSRALWGALTGPGGALADRPITRVVVTHAHADHVGGAAHLQAAGATLLTTRTTWLIARMLWLDHEERPRPQQVAFWRAAGMPAALLARRADERPWNAADVCAQLPLGYTRLIEGQRLRLGHRDWTIRMGEGHAAEHATLWADDGVILGGDQLLPAISPNLGVYASEPDADPVGDWLDSCAALAVHATDDQLVLPGHGLPFTGLPFRLASLIDKHRAALDRLAAVLADEPRTAVGCFDILYRRRIADAEYGLALVEAVAHVNRLRREGRVRAVGTTPDGGTLWGG